MSLWDCPCEKEARTMYSPKPLHIEDAVKLLVQSLQATSDPELFSVGTYGITSALDSNTSLKRPTAVGLPRSQQPRPYPLLD